MPPKLEAEDLEVIDIATIPDIMEWYPTHKVAGFTADVTDDFRDRYEFIELWNRVYQLLPGGGTFSVKAPWETAEWHQARLRATGFNYTGCEAQNEAVVLTFDRPRDESRWNLASQARRHEQSIIATNQGIPHADDQ